MNDTKLVINSREKVENPTTKVTNFRWVIMLLLFLLYTVANADRANIGVALPFMRKEIPMTNTQAGAISSLFFAGYAISMIPAGFIVTKFGVRSTFSISMILTSICTGAVALVSGLLPLRLIRFLTGITEAPVAVGASTLVNNWFPPKEKGTAMGIFLAASKCGPLVVPTICGLLIQAFGWRSVFTAFAIPGILISIIAFFLIRNRPSDSKFCSKSEIDYIADKTVEQVKENKPKREYKLYWLDKLVRAKKVERLDTNAKVFTSWNIIGTALGYFFMVGIVSVMMSWIPTYLTNVKHLAIMKMAIVASAPFAGTVVGNLIGGWFSDRYLNKRRKPLIIVTATSTSIMMYSLIYAPANPALLAMLLFLTGILLALGYSAFMVYPMGITTQEKFPIAGAVVNTGGQLGGFVTPLVVGMILDKFNWNMVFATLACGSIICLLVVLTIIEPVEDPLV